MGRRHMANVRYVQVDTNVTCLVTEDGWFIGAVKTSSDPAQPWSYAVNGKGAKILDLRAIDHRGQDLKALFMKCQHALLNQS